jgi:hypothetical protein
LVEFESDLAWRTNVMKKLLSAAAVAASFALATLGASTTADAARRAVRADVPVPPGVAPGGVAFGLYKPYYQRGFDPGYYYLYPLDAGRYRPVPVYYRYYTPGPYFGCWRYGVFVC